MPESDSSERETAASGVVYLKQKRQPGQKGQRDSDLGGFKMADTPKCEDCGGTEFIGAGSKLDKQGKWHMIQCTACAHKQKDKLIVQFKKKRFSGRGKPT